LYCCRTPLIYRQTSCSADAQDIYKIYVCTNCLQSDPREKINLNKSQPALAASLRARLHALNGESSLLRARGHGNTEHGAMSYLPCTQMYRVLPYVYVLTLGGLLCSGEFQPGSGHRRSRSMRAGGAQRGLLRALDVTRARVRGGLLCHIN
jgi:hypothetical protein